MPNPVDLTDPIYNDDEAARAYIEAQRWPDGPHCPHCGEAERVTKLKGKSTRPGLYSCASCRQHFTVTVGTIYERSHLPLHTSRLLTGFPSECTRNPSSATCSFTDFGPLLKNIQTVYC